MTAHSLVLGGRLDRYVGRLFVQSYLAAFLIVVGLYVIADMAVNLDEYLRQHADGTTPGTATVGRFYLLHLPFLYLEMSPFVMLVAGIFTAAKMVRHNEVVAALNAGISTRRLLLAVFLGAVILAAGMFALREWATGALGAERDALREYLMEQRTVQVYENFWVKDVAGRRLRIDEYRPRPGEGRGPEMRGLICRIAGAEDTIAIDARRAFDPRLVDGRWTWSVEDGYVTHVSGTERRRERLESFDAVDVGPADVDRAWKGREHPLDLSFGEVRDLLARDPESLQYRTVRQYHMSFPLSGVVLLLVGLPFVVRPRRGRGIERMAAGFLLCFLYFGTDFIARTLGLQGQIGPIFAAWTPLVLYGSLGAVLFGGMRS